MIRGRRGTFLGGEMKVDPVASREVLRAAAALDISVAELADSVIQLAESNIVRAIQQVSTERGAIRAATPLCRLVAPARYMPRGWRKNSASRKSSCRRMRVCSRRPVC